jgi:hypothetical protein
MSGALESSVTLEDVFVVVGARRAPLAPELAGYLTLEIAEGSGQATGEVDPRSVYIGEEGSVAVVNRPRPGPATGDTEGSIRTLLARLLEASGSQTPALGAVARKRPSGMNGLIEELEAALIPVNRAAGRRALARLAREVKRVTLGVGRNASLAPGEPAREGPRRPGTLIGGIQVMGAPLAAPAREADRVEEPRAGAKSGFAEEGATARRDALADAPFRESAATLERVGPPPDPPTARSTHDSAELPAGEVRKEQIAAALAAKSNPPPRVDSGKGTSVDEVDHLLASFAVSSRTEQAARNELKALVGLEPTPPPPGSGAGSSHESDVEALLAQSGSSSHPIPPVRGLASPATAISPILANEPITKGDGRTVASALAPPGSWPRIPQAKDASSPPIAGTEAATRASHAKAPDARAAPTAPSARRLVDLSQPAIKPRSGAALPIVALVILGAGGAALWYLGPGSAGGHGSTPSPIVAGAGPTPPPPVTVAPKCRETLAVNDAPPNSEILIRAGQAPVDVDRMPVGARLEFVATAEGFAPKRVVVPSGATWDTGPDGKPRYEVAVQLDATKARPGAIDPWPPAEPGSEVGGKGSPGTVHLVSTPRGAEVWLLAGLGPKAQIDQLKCGGDVDVLVAGPSTLRKRLHVAEAAFLPVDGGTDRAATISGK